MLGFKLDIEHLRVNEEVKFTKDHVGLAVRMVLATLFADKGFSEENLQYFEAVAKSFQKSHFGSIKDKVDDKKIFTAHMQMIYSSFKRQYLDRYRNRRFDDQKFLNEFLDPERAHYAIEANLGNPFDEKLRRLISRDLSLTFYKLIYLAAVSNSSRSRGAIDLLRKFRKTMKLKPKDCLAVSREIYFRMWDDGRDPLSDDEKRAVFGIAIKIMFLGEGADQDENRVLNHMLEAFKISDVEEFKADIKDIYNSSLEDLVEKVSREHYPIVLTFLFEMTFADGRFCKEENLGLQEIVEKMDIDAKDMIAILARAEFDHGHRIRLDQNNKIDYKMVS